MATLEETLDKAIEVAVKRALLDAHPVGSIYLTINDENPSTKFGGTWEKLPSSVCLQTADTSHGAGTTIAAGLPSLPEIDILYRRDCTATGVEVNKYGNDGIAFSGDVPTNTAGTDEYMQSCLAHGYKSAPYGARYSSSNVYGKSTTVQPPAYALIAWRRTA